MRIHALKLPAAEGPAIWSVVAESLALNHRQQLAICPSRILRNLKRLRHHPCLLLRQANGWRISEVIELRGRLRLFTFLFPFRFRNLPHRIFMERFHRHPCFLLRQANGWRVSEVIEGGGRLRLFTYVFPFRFRKRPHSDGLPPLFLFRFRNLPRGTVPCQVTPPHPDRLPARDLLHQGLGAASSPFPAATGAEARRTSSGRRMQPQRMQTRPASPHRQPLDKLQAMTRGRAAL